MGNLFIFSAPSGTGKSTLINYLMKQPLNLEFSISATSRPPRGDEKNGVEYYFITPDEFRKKIANDEFLEYEEVYQNCFYGTLKSEVERITSQGSHVVFDVDVIGAFALKKQYGNRALSIFLQPPSIEVLRGRLEKRGTDSSEIIEDRLQKAVIEMQYATKFDVVVVNDDFDLAKSQIMIIINKFLEEQK